MSKMPPARVYIEKWLKIRTKEGDVVPLMLNEPQRRLMDEVERQEAAGKPVRIIILKARQMGFSTLTEALIFYRTATAFATDSMIVAHTDEATGNLFRMSRRYYDELPPILRPMLRASNAQELDFNRPTKSKVKVKGLDSRIRLRMGVYPNVDKDIDLARRFDRAKMAADTVRNSFTRAVAVYDEALHDSEMFAEQLLEDFPEAIAQKQFVVYYQPKFAIQGTMPVLNSAEALVRWNHPRFGLVSPGNFIPLFESNGFVKKLDEYMWETACEYLARLKNMDELIPISVNISRFHINNTDLVRVLTDMINRHGIDPRYLELEITETLFTDNAEDLYATMQRLKDIGFLIEMDDFGSGYSSLNMLRRAPVDIIKIDRYFIDKIMSTKRGRIIVENSVSMSRQLGLKVVAEGVETKEQADFLKSINCDVAQGYYYSKPVTTDEFEKLLTTMR